MKHIMIDLETLGTKPGCVVLSIGAVTFDPYTGKLGEEWYRKMNWQMQELDIEPGTWAWWLEQSAEARIEAFSGTANLPLVGHDFRAFWVDQNAEFLWCHGATFDAPVWEAAAGFAPWRYNQVRDTRTVYDMAQVFPDRTVGTHHNALDDARNQAVAVCAAYKKLGIGAP